MSTIASTTIPRTMRDKKTMIQVSIYAQTGQLLPNLRRHESAPITDIDELLNSPVKVQPNETKHHNRHQGSNECAQYDRTRSSEVCLLLFN